ncbi:MAG: PQQ-binding-like beta-propeller repeat protein [Ktedonobacteraceae bacterium]|nr:PQQ-binding-like beta-propeller repeat protein [Ktedonobacteraceae bacterium]
MAEQDGPLTGRQLGNYRLLQLLGKGGFAEVYLGEHIHLGTMVAIKVLNLRIESSDVDQFRTEARTIAHLVHPHIVRVFDFGLEHAAPYLVMDYAPNGTLRNLYPRGTRLSLSEIVKYSGQVADALQYAHNQHVIHRDIKPENILLGRDNDALLSDFGIALISQTSRLQTAQDIAGTIAYMAPEQIESHPRPASDQYSLGIVVYEWLCGERPFQGSFTEIAVKQTMAPPPPLRERVPEISINVEKVVMTALAKDPQARFATVAAFAQALARAAEDAPTLITAEPLVPPLNRSLPQAPVSSGQSGVNTPPGHTYASAGMDQDGGATMEVAGQTTPPRVVPPQPPLVLPSLEPVVSGPISDASVPEQTRARAWEAPLLTPRPGSPPAPARKGPPVGRVVLLVAVVLLILAGSFGVFYLRGHASQNTGVITPTATTPHHGTTPTVTVVTAQRGDATMFGFGPQHTRFNADEHTLTATNVARLVQNWAFSTGGLINSSPAVVDGNVYIGSDDHNLYAFKAATGKLLWSFPTGDVIGSSPAVADGVVYIGSFDHNLYAIDAASGKPKWKFSTHGNIFSSPVVVKGVVYVGSYDRNVYAINAQTGKQIWSFHTENQVVSSPAVVNGVVYVGSYDNNVYAINAERGKQIWVYPTGGAIDSAPAIVDGMLYIGSQDKKIYALNASSGTMNWYFITNDAILSSPAVVHGVVYVGSMDGMLYSFTGGNVNWKFTPASGCTFKSSPMVANGVVYSGCSDGHVYALDASTGNQLWSYTTRGEVRSSPTVVNGAVYVGSHDSKVYRFGLPS